MQNCEREARRLLPNLPAVLIDTRKWNPQRIVIVKVPATDHRKVLWDAYALIQRVIHGAHRQGIVKTEHTVGLGLETQ